jgi:hypothetical protein
MDSATASGSRDQFIDTSLKQGCPKPHDAGLEFTF